MHGCYARTYPECIEFTPQHVAAMRRLLLAHCTFSPSMAYCQGMNFVAGWMLLVYGLEREEEAFCAFAGSLAHICPDYFAKNLIGSMADQVIKL